MNWPWINYWKQSLLWCLGRICLQCVPAAFFHVHLSLNRAWYRHKTWFYRNFRTLVPWTLHLNANLTAVCGTKVNKTGKCKTSFFPLLLLQLKSSCLKCRGPPSWALPAYALTIFLAVISPADLHVLGPQWVETEFQAEVPRNSIKGVVMDHYVKNTDYNSAGKELAKPCLLCSANIYEHSGGSSVLWGRSQASGQIMFPIFGAKTCFFHTAFQEKYFVFPTD